MDRRGGRSEGRVDGEGEEGGKEEEIVNISIERAVQMGECRKKKPKRNCQIHKGSTLTIGRNEDQDS